MFSLRLTARDNTSKHKINKYGEMGSPCLHPSSHLKRSERYPKFKLALELSLQNNLIHLCKECPKLNDYKVLSMKSQSIVSNVCVFLNRLLTINLEY